MNCLIVIIGSHGSDEQLPPTTRISEGIAARLKRRPIGTRRSACGMVAAGPNSWLAAYAGMLRCSMDQRVDSASVPESQASRSVSDPAAFRPTKHDRLREATP